MNWEEKLQQQLPLLGHRNWIVVSDWAYPAQVGAGFDVVWTGQDYLQVLKKTLHMIETFPHVRPRIWMDREFGFLDDDLLPGISNLKQEIEMIFKGHRIEHAVHVELIRVLEEASKSYRVLLLKTNITYPYVSVFFELDCGYWHADKEKLLRQKMVIGKTMI